MITSQSDLSLNFKCPYHASVMKMFEMKSSKAVVMVHLRLCAESDFAPVVFSCSPSRAPQRSGDEIAVSKAMSSIDRRMRDHKLARGGRERSISGVAMPSTRRRLSG